MDTLPAVVGDLEPGRLSGEAAVRLMEVFTEAERLAAAGRTMIALRVDESNCWRPAGYKSAARFLADKNRTSLGAAVGTLETARAWTGAPPRPSGVFRGLRGRRTRAGPCRGRRGVRDPRHRLAKGGPHGWTTWPAYAAGTTT